VGVGATVTFDDCVFNDNVAENAQGMRTPVSHRTACSDSTDGLALTHLALWTELWHGLTNQAVLVRSEGAQVHSRVKTHSAGNTRTYTKDCKLWPRCTPSPTGTCGGAAFPPKAMCPAKRRSTPPDKQRRGCKKTDCQGTVGCVDLFGPSIVYSTTSRAVSHGSVASDPPPPLRQYARGVR